MVAEIYSAIETVTGITKLQLQGRDKHLEVSRRRNMTCALLTMLGMSESSVGFELHRNRSTVRTAKLVHKSELEYDGRYAAEYAQILSKISVKHVARDKV